MAGLEVEECRSVAPSFTKVVVSKVIEIKPHPDADRLKVCTVEIAPSHHLQIVCGAPNVRVGMMVPCALIGANLPLSDGSVLKIKQRN